MIGIASRPQRPTTTSITGEATQLETPAKPLCWTQTQEQGSESNHPNVKPHRSRIWREGCFSKDEAPKPAGQKSTARLLNKRLFLSFPSLLTFCTARKKLRNDWGKNSKVCVSAMTWPYQPRLRLVSASLARVGLQPCIAWVGLNDTISPLMSMIRTFRWFCVLVLSKICIERN